MEHAGLCFFSLLEGPSQSSHPFTIPKKKHTFGKFVEIKLHVIFHRTCDVKVVKPSFGTCAKGVEIRVDWWAMDGKKATNLKQVAMWLIICPHHIFHSKFCPWQHHPSQYVHWDKNKDRRMYTFVHLDTRTPSVPSISRESSINVNYP